MIKKLKKKTLIGEMLYVQMPSFMAVHFILLNELSTSFSDDNNMVLR